MFFGKKNPNESGTASNIRRRFHHLLISKRKDTLPKNVVVREHSKRQIKTVQSPALLLARKLALFALIIVVLIGGFYLVFFSSFFTITKIGLEKPGNAVSGSELAPFLDKLKGKNLLFINTDSLTTELEQTFKNEILLVRISKSPPNKLIVKVDEYPAIINLRVVTGNKIQKLVLNQLGYAIAEGVEDKALPIVIMNSDKQFPKQSVVMDPSRLEKIRIGFSKFTELFGMKITQGEYLKRERELHMMTEKNFEIWLDLTSDVERQLTKLKRATVKLDLTTTPLEYVDLRIAGGESEKVIFKRRK